MRRVGIELSALETSISLPVNVVVAIVMAGLMMVSADIVKECRG